MDEGKRETSPSWILQHPVYRDLQKLGVDDDAQVFGAFLVYLDLTEVRRWTRVNAVSCPDLKAVLLEGRERDDEGLQVVFPLPAHRGVSHRDLRCIVGRGTPMLLCAVASDSTLVYQRLSDGLVTPDPPWTSETWGADNIANGVSGRDGGSACVSTAIGIPRALLLQVSSGRGRSQSASMADDCDCVLPSAGHD